MRRFTLTLVALSLFLSHAIQAQPLTPTHTVERPGLPELAEAVRALRGLPGLASLLVLEGGRERAALNADMPLAVGSVCKLAVLAALKDQIASGKRTWRDVVALRPNWKSVPSGVLRNWPDGSLLTLETLATLMVAHNDNTATDGLIHTVGRGAIEGQADRNRPFLTTREWSVLKDPRNQDLLDRYRSGEEGTRRAVLPAVQGRPLPGSELFTGKPRAFDVEWFFTARELCSLIARVSDLPFMGINPGVADPADWRRVAHLGGSEPGVLNLTTRVEARDGRSFCVAATWNDDRVLDGQRLSRLVAAILDVLK